MSTYTAMSKKAPRQSLVEWIIATESVSPAQPQAKRTKQLRGSPPPSSAGPRPAVPRYVLLREWGFSNFGEHCPHQNTLLSWANKGKIQPPAKKVGGKWFVRPDAEFVDD